VGDDAYLNLEGYFQLEGLAYRLIPVRMRSADGQTGKVNTDIMYNNMMKKFAWGGLDKSALYMDENNIRMTMNLRNNFARLAQELIREGKKDKAKEVLNHCMKVLPLNNVPPNFFLMPLAECYYQLDQKAEADRLCKLLFDQYEQELSYYQRFRGKMADNIDYERQQAMGVLQRLSQLTGMYGQQQLSKDFEARLNKAGGSNMP
jgi:tetratricopeptide (TPR) repeat protein